MSPVWGLLVLVVLFMMGMPVAYAIGISSVVIMAASTGIKWVTISSAMIQGLDSFTILCIPLFLLSGKLMNRCGITDRLFTFCRALVGWFPGGLGHVNVLASFIFAGMSGTAVADAAGMDLEYCFRYAVAGASAAIMTPGTQLVRKEDFDMLLKMVEIFRID